MSLQQRQHNCVRIFGTLFQWITPLSSCHRIKHKQDILLHKLYMVNQSQQKYMHSWMDQQQSLFMNDKKNVPFIPLLECNNSIAQISKTETNAYAIKNKECC